MPAADSSAFFKKYLQDNGLYSDLRWKNLLDKKWDTMCNYAFAWGNIEQGKVPDVKEFKAVVNCIEGFDYEDIRTWEMDTATNQKKKPKEPPYHLYRRTMFDSRMMTSVEMAKRWKSGEDSIRKLTKEERQDRRERIKVKYGPLSGCMVGEKEPSEALEDTLHGWKEMNRITHPISLGECTSVDMEWNLRRLQPNKKPRMEAFDRGDGSLIVTPVKDAAEARTDVHTTHQLEMALTRLGYALELADLLDFTVFHRWIEELMKGLDGNNLLTDRTLTVNECIYAHDYLFKIMEVDTRHSGIRREMNTGKHPLERALSKAMDSKQIERALVPGLLGARERAPPTKKPEHKNTEGKSKSALKKEKTIARATTNKDKEIEELKKLIEQGKSFERPRKGKDKGKGKGKDKSGPPLPEGLKGGKHQGTSGDGRRICFGYNLKGCDGCEPGKECKKGWHICSIKGCKGTHSANDCDKK